MYTHVNMQLASHFGIYMCNMPTGGGTAYARVKMQCTIKHIPAHVGILGNERADRLAKAAAKRGYAAASRTFEQQQEIELEAVADSILAAILAKLA